MAWSSRMVRSRSSGGSSSRARTAIRSTVSASIGMGGLREGREDLLDSGAPELDPELGPLPHPFASHPHALPELRMDHAQTDRARLRSGALAPARGRARRALPHARLLHHQAILRNLGDETGDASADRVPDASIVG